LSTVSVENVTRRWFRLHVLRKDRTIEYDVVVLVLDID
jgi:hypothetical protein